MCIQSGLKIRKKMGEIPKWIVYIKKYFSLYNFYTKATERKSFRNAILCIHIGLATWCTFITLSAFVDLMQVMKLLDAMNFVIYYTNLSFTSCIIILESYKCRVDLHVFWHIFIQINNNYYSQAKFRQRNYLLIFILTPIIDVAFTVFAIFNETTSPIVQKFMMLIVENFSSTRLLFYLLHLKVIEFQLQKIENELTNIQKFYHSTKHIGYDKRIRIQFKWIRKYYELIYEMSVLVNSTFGWTALVFVILNCHCSITFLSFFYRQMNRKFSLFNYGLKLNIFNKKFIC